MSATNTTESTELGDNGSASPPNIGSALVAENRFVVIEGATLVYRRFGNAEIKAPPLVCLQHFRGNLDNWDPALIDRLAHDREVILLANRGVGASTGVVPDNVSDMARDVIRFVDALPLREIDLLGFSLGGYIGQELASSAPGLIRNLCSPARRRKALRRSTAGRTMSTRLLPKTYPTGGRIELAHPCVRSAAYRDARRGLPPHPSRTRRGT